MIDILELKDRLRTLLGLLGSVEYQIISQQNLPKDRKLSDGEVLDMVLNLVKIARVQVEEITPQGDERYI